MAHRTVSTFRTAAKYARRIGRDLGRGSGAISLPCRRHLRLGCLRGRGFTGHEAARGRSTASWSNVAFDKKCHSETFHPSR